VKRVLVIANLYHASPRIPALLTFLSEYGWRATVVTRPLGADAESLLGLPRDFFRFVDIAPAPYRGDVFWILRELLAWFGFSSKSSYTEQLKDRVGGGRAGKSWVDRLMLSYQMLLAIPDTEWPWYRSAVRVANAQLKQHAFDVILSSSPVPTVHLVAATLKKRHGIPWVADLRDLWSQNHNYAFPAPRRWLDRRLELRALKSADMLTTISRPLEEKLKSLHGDRVAIVRNGYQPIANVLVTPQLPDLFTISYTGTIYAGKQDPARLLVALHNLLKSGRMAAERVAANFYGRQDSLLQQLVNELGLQDVVAQKGMLPRSEIRRRQKESHLLLLLQWEDASEEGIFPLKLFEYLDSGRPVLATGGSASGEIPDILYETQAGVVATTTEEVEQALLQAYDVFSAGGPPAYRGDLDAIAQYSYSGCANQLSDCLRRVIERQGCKDSHLASRER
jgi:glycosyltransferase involved in cell wall biosynthesis